MITFEHHGIKVKCKPENAMQYRAAMDKPPKAKTVSEKRGYPVFVAGMSTSDYVSQFNRQFDGSQHKIKHDCPNYYKPAPMLDASVPEVLEELDPDYIPTAKPRKITAKQAIVQALDALKAGDIDTAQCILTEALK
jgi:adenosylmethionine-8-amino-7-oxononanoate aminotransferase